MLKRLMRCTIWILSALMAVASLDKIPDPPALDPHMLAVKARGPSECAETPSGPAGDGGLPDLLAPFETPTFLARNIEPDCPSSLTIRTGHAADPSPPVL
jgi:hypothetical protein